MGSQDLLLSNMRACLILLSSLALVSLAQKVPVKCDWEKEKMCPGEWDPKSNQQITADFCIPNKVGDCMNYCPTKCAENDMMCPGKMGPDGCKMADFCNAGKFCPVDCDWAKEKSCPGMWEKGQQITPDTCMPMKVGDCMNHCPVDCAFGDMMCPGKMGPDGCKMPDTCHSGKFCPVDCDWAKEKSCPGMWEKGQQITPDTCMPMKVGDCMNHCPVDCAFGDMMCPGKMGPDGCKMPDTCHSGKFCPVDCDWAKEKSCPGMWEKGQQITPDTCMPMKVGDCMNHCPVQCAPGDMMCPGKMDSMGCKMPDTCHNGKFCPVHCEMGNKQCPGKWENGQQITPDTCIPMKVGDCVNHCPVNCAPGDMMCPGKMDPNGCKMPDTCHSGKFCPADCDWSKERVCPGMWENGQQITSDTCIPMKNGDCMNHCPMHCGKEQMMCPGKMDPNGCKMPDMCLPAGGQCPAP